MADTHTYPAGADTLKAPWHASDRRCEECVREEVLEAFAALLSEYIGPVVRYVDGRRRHQPQIPEEWQATLWLLQDAAAADCNRSDLCDQHAPKREDYD